ncbi:lipase [Actinomadura fulvescens]|uniref:Alpha/beta hydrolase n=1 Tax=Actinomadura fulvescens TaxID=46160 RepID=A0ABP6BVA6_9ACTN
MSAFTSDPTRRSVLTSAGTAALLLAATGTAAAGRPPATARGGIRLALPRPTGPYPVGTTSLHLIDRSRQDPWMVPATPRELMISLWYPARVGGGHRVAPWLPPATLALYRQQTARSLQTSLDNVDFPQTHARHDAPFKTRRQGHPLVLFSPGYRAMRELGSSLVEDLASHGYVVVTIGHTHEAQIVEFPGGRIELGHLPARPTDDDAALALRVRQDDTRFVLDTLSAKRGRLPHGSLDMSKVGMFGHSLGGATAAEAMAHDPRILAGANLDGSIIGPVAETGLDRPFLLMASTGHGRDNDPSWAQFWSHLRGWHRHLLLRDSGHQTYTDLAPLARQLINKLPIPPQVVTALTNDIGTINASRAITAQRAYLGAYFDLHLRHRDGHLFSKPSSRYPEIEFIP